MTEHPKTLDEKGRCCGRKPTPYRRDNKLCCRRCHRDYDLTTGEQRKIYHFVAVEDGFITCDAATPEQLDAHARRRLPSFGGGA